MNLKKTNKYSFNLDKKNSIIYIIFSTIKYKSCLYNLNYYEKNTKTLGRSKGY